MRQLKAGSMDMTGAMVQEAGPSATARAWWRERCAVLVTVALLITAGGCSDDGAVTAAQRVATTTTTMPASQSGPAASPDAGSVVSASTATATVAVPVASMSEAEAKLAVDTVALPADASTVLGDAVSPAGDAVSVTLSSGTLTGPAQVAFRLPADFDTSRYVPGVVWADGSGGWTLLASSWSPGELNVTATTTHFSIGWPIKIDVSKIGHGIVDWVKGLVTGRAGVANPTCGDEQAPRSTGISVVSDTGDLVKWCYGRDNGRDVVKITNNWRAGTMVTFPKTWQVVDYQGAGFDFQAIGDWLDSVSRETATTRSRLVASGDTIVLDPGAVTPGSSTSAVAEPSTVSYLWSILSTAVDMYLLTVGKLAKLDGNTKAEDLITGAGFIKCYTSYYGNQINASGPVEPESTFGTITTAVKFGLDCGKDVIQDALTKRGGLWKTLGVAVVGVIAAAIGVVYGLANELFSGIRSIIDDIGNLFDRNEVGGFGYDIVLSAATIPAVPAATLIACDGVDRSVIPKAFYFGHSYCSTPWAVVLYMTLDDAGRKVGPDIALIDMTGRSHVAATWPDAKGEGSGTFSAAALVAVGVPEGQAQVLADAADLGAPVADADTLALELDTMFNAQDFGGLATHWSDELSAYYGDPASYYDSLFNAMASAGPLPQAATASCRTAFFTDNPDSDPHPPPERIGDLTFFCDLKDASGQSIGPWVSMNGDLSGAYIGLGG